MLLCPQGKHGSDGLEIQPTLQPSERAKYCTSSSRSVRPARSHREIPRQIGRTDGDDSSTGEVLDIGIDISEGYR